MKITVFTSNQPRHTSLIETLARIADEVFAVQECNTVFPGRVADFYRKSEVMQTYFGRVTEAEATVFGRPRFAPPNVRHLPLKMGDLNLLERDALAPALESDVYVVFGASFIKGDLCKHLVEQQTLNIHMGTSPYYRGAACNFWALYDDRPDYVGATIHRLTAGLDSGPILFTALPPPEPMDGFLLGMRAVKAAHVTLAQALSSGELASLAPVAQDRTLELHYTRSAEFTDEVAAAYLSRVLDAEQIAARLRQRDVSRFVRARIA